MRMNVVLVFASVVLYACGPAVTDDPFNGDSPDGAPGQADARQSPNEFADAAPPEACSKMDILFVIDDSGSMSEEQSNLASNFPAFINVINNYVNQSGDALDYRIGITTTGRDLNYTISVGGISLPFSESGDNGALRQGSGMTRRWLERNDPNAASTFASVAQVGTGGPSIEMPLLAVDWALNDRVADGTNAGFLRDDALLALVILTDEDDCSREDNNFTISSDACTPNTPPQVHTVDSYISMLDTVKGERGRWATAVIAGPSSCTSDFGDAIEATRLKQFVADTGENAVFSSICNGDLSSALQDALDTFSAACESFPPIP